MGSTEQLGALIEGVSNAWERYKQADRVGDTTGKIMAVNEGLDALMTPVMNVWTFGGHSASKAGAQAAGDALGNYLSGDTGVGGAVLEYASSTLENAKGLIPAREAARGVGRNLDKDNTAGDAAVVLYTLQLLVEVGTLSYGMAKAGSRSGPGGSAPDYFPNAMKRPPGKAVQNQLKNSKNPNTSCVPTAARELLDLLAEALGVSADDLAARMGTTASGTPMTALTRVLREVLGEGRVNRWNNATLNVVRDAVRGGGNVIVEVATGQRGADGRYLSHAVVVDKAYNSPGGTIFGVRDPNGGGSFWVSQSDLSRVFTGQAVAVSSPPPP